MVRPGTNALITATAVSLCCGCDFGRAAKPEETALEPAHDPATGSGSMSPVRGQPSGTAAAGFSAGTPPQGTVNSSLGRAIPALDGVLFGSTLVTLTRDRDQLRAFDVATGEPGWQADLGDAGPTDPQIQRLDGDHLLVWSPSRLRVFDAATGTLQHEHATRSRGRYLWRRGDACGLSGECSLELIDCTDARPIGREINGAYQSRRSIEGGVTTGCWGFDVDLLGRDGDHVVVHASNTHGRVDDGFAAFDVRSGRRVWRSTALHCDDCSPLGTGSAGELCWATSERELRVFGCHDGRPRWRKSLSGAPRLITWVATEPPGLYVLTDSTAMCLDARSGRHRWQVAAEPHTLAIAAGSRFPDQGEILLRQAEPTEVVWLDDADGAAIGRQALPANATLIADPPGRWLMVDRYPPWDTAGHRVPTALPPFFEVNRDRAPASGRGPPNRASVSVRSRQRPLLETDSDAWSLGEYATGDQHILVLYVVGRERTATGEIRLVRTPPATPENRREDVGVTP